MRNELPNPVNPNDRRRIARMNDSIRSTNSALEHWRNRVVRPGQSIPLPREVGGQEEEREITSVERERGDSWVDIMNNVRRCPIGKRHKKIV